MGRERGGRHGGRGDEERQIIRFVRIIGLRSHGAANPGCSPAPATVPPLAICPKCLPRLPGSASSSPPLFLFLPFFLFPSSPRPPPTPPHPALPFRPPSRDDNENGQVWNWRAIFGSLPRPICNLRKLSTCSPLARPARYETARATRASRNAAPARPGFYRSAVICRRTVRFLLKPKAGTARLPSLPRRWNFY